MTNAQAVQAQTQTAEELTLLDSIVEQSRIARNEEEHDRAKSLIGELAKEVMAGTITVSENMTLSIDKRIAEIDALISAQLSKIMHHEQFQKIESTWRGLYYFCQETPSNPLIKIRMLNTTKKNWSKISRARLILIRVPCSRKFMKKSMVHLVVHRMRL